MQTHDNYPKDLRFVIGWKTTENGEYALTHKEILMQLGKLEKEVKGNSKDIENIFMVLRELIEKQSTPPPPPKRNTIGYKQYDKKE